MADNSVKILKSEKGRDLCRVRGEGGIFLGFRKDILTENLSERDNAFLVCARCQGILREVCILSTGEQFCSCCTKGEEQTHPNMHVRDTVLSLKCSCPLSQRGCEWLGTLGECENHLDVCSHVHEKCKLGCEIALPRHELKIHVSEKCKLRGILCEHCQTDLKAQDLPNHLEECQNIPQTCELGCGILVCREDMARHLEEECVEKKVECPFRKYKCEVGLIKRKELNQHLEEKRTEHTELKLSAMEEILLQQGETNFSQSEKIHTQNELIEQMSQEIETLKTEAKKEAKLNKSEEHPSPKITKLLWWIHDVQYRMRPFLRFSSPQKQFQADGYHFIIRLYSFLDNPIEIQVNPQYGFGNVPFKAIFVTYLICPSNPNGTKELGSTLVEMHKREVNRYVFKTFAKFSRSYLSDEFIKERGIQLEIFLHFQ
ncbi:TNF receptor-associated factor 4-like isoform X1 [Oopsacas minuta]|uniref:TNF receptor-associated factor 4-like isoform X1 n=1 Tax=Oopsacas minuta TaxID=111878 RepID=A0AAV7JEP3_9METZ|nr:TNF receptor-associated factor 4-like isoform X1 [Oopsacas minuta]